jgi:hypothetical protein
MKCAIPNCKVKGSDMTHDFRIVIELFLIIPLLAGCAVVRKFSNAFKITPTVTVSLTPTISPTITQTWTPTITLTPSVTPIPTDVPEVSLHEWDHAVISIKGKSVEFVMGMENGSDVQVIWNKWGIINLELNKAGNYQERFAKLIEAALWQVSTNGGSLKSFDEFLQNSDQYPIVFVEPDEKGGFRDKSIKLDDIKRIEWRFINTTDKRLYFLNAQISPSVGYKMMDDGTLEIYTAPVESGNMDTYTNDPYFKRLTWNDKVYLIGDDLGDFLLRDMLEMNYTHALYSENGSSEGENQKSFSDNFIDTLNIVRKAADSRVFKDGTWATEIIAYDKSYGYWNVVMK